MTEDGDFFCAMGIRCMLMEWPIFTGHYEGLRKPPKISPLRIQSLTCRKAAIPSPVAPDDDASIDMNRHSDT